MRANQSGFWGTFLVTLVALMIAVGFGELYSLVISSLKVSPWIGVILAHGCISVILYVISHAVRSSLQLSGTSYFSWIPSVGILVGAFSLAFLTSQTGPSYAVQGSNELVYILATLTVIPVFEEIVFRAGVTPILSRLAGPVWSIWFSALIFSVAHTHPTWERIVGFKAGFMLGPFLLGICCDMIVRRWGKLWPAIAFHSACNATVYIFSTFNPAWLAKLGVLYM